jgi:hypothetical protein
VPQEKCNICSDKKPDKRIILLGHPASNLNALEGIRGIASLSATGENTSLHESTFRIYNKEWSTRYDRTVNETFLNPVFFPYFYRPIFSRSRFQFIAASPWDGYLGRTVSTVATASGYHPSFFDNSIPFHRALKQTAVLL